MATTLEESPKTRQQAPSAGGIAGRYRWTVLVAVASVVALLAAALVGYWAGGGFDTADPGEAVADRVMEAWATGDTEAIEDTYAPDVVLVLDGSLIVDDRDAMAQVIDDALALGNTYEQIGPVTSYQGANGDLYVSTLVEVAGPGRSDGEPLVGFYRVRDDVVVRHVFWQAPMH
jgi:ketosteroid isomerase-like protein